MLRDLNEIIKDICGDNEVLEREIRGSIAVTTNEIICAYSLMQKELLFSFAREVQTAASNQPTSSDFKQLDN